MTVFGASLSRICRKKNKQELWRHEGNLPKDLDDWLPFICTKNHWIFNDFNLVVKFEIQQFWRLPLVFQFCWNSAQRWSLRPRTHDFGMDIKIGKNELGDYGWWDQNSALQGKTHIQNGILRTVCKDFQWRVWTRFAQGYLAIQFPISLSLSLSLSLSPPPSIGDATVPISSAIAEPLSKTLWGAWVRKAANFWRIGAGGGGGFGRIACMAFAWCGYTLILWRFVAANVMSVKRRILAQRANVGFIVLSPMLLMPCSAVMSI